MMRSNGGSSGKKRRRILSTRGIVTVFGIVGCLSYSIGSWQLSSKLLWEPYHSSSTIMTPNPPTCPPPRSNRSAATITSNTANTTDFGFLCQDPAVSYLQIAEESSSITLDNRRRPKILCVVLTVSKYHATRMQAVFDTWGRKCDMLIAASDETDPTLHAYRIESSTAGYWGIWDKLMQTLRQIVVAVDDPTTNLNTNSRTIPAVDPDDYDWILKADDDTYVIMENLHAFLANLTHNGDDKNYNEPLIYGRTMAWPRLKRFRDMEGWFERKGPASINQAFGERFYSKLDESQTLRFSHGGPGYLMNRKYAQTLVQAYFNNSGNAVKGEIAEDIANALTMLYHDIRPQSTFDMEAGRERMHPESPQTMYANPIWLEKMHHGMKASVRGEGEKCCSPRSISFHYVADFQMRLLDYQLYHCPKK